MLYRCIKYRSVQEQSLSMVALGGSGSKENRCWSLNSRNTHFVVEREEI